MTDATARPVAKAAVTVVVPTRNRADRLARALASVGAQTTPPERVVVVDDASEDGTEAVVRRFAASSVAVVDYVRQPRRRGPARCRNVGAGYGDTPFVAFLDSDDVWLPEHLVTSVAAVGVGVQGAVSGFIARSPRGDRHPAGPARGTMLAAPLEGVLARRYDTRSSTLLLRRELFEATPFDEHLDRYEDWDLVARAARRWRIVATGERTVVLHEGHRDRASQVMPHPSFERFYARHAPHLHRRARFALLVDAAWSTLAAEGRSSRFWWYWLRSARQVAPDRRRLALWLLAAVPGAQRLRSYATARALARVTRPTQVSGES